MLRSHSVAGGPKQVTGHDHNTVTILHSLIDGVNAVLIGVASGLVVAALQACIAAKLGHTFVRILIEGVIVNVAYIGHKGNLLCAIGAGYGGIFTGGLCSRLCGGFGRHIRSGLGGRVSRLGRAILTASKQTGDHRHCQQQGKDLLHVSNLQNMYDIGFLRHALQGVPYLII